MMLFPILLLSIPFVLALIYLLQNTKTTLPPGPRQFPIIGNLLDLGSKPHQSFTNLSKAHGSLMSVKLGSILTIVISSPQIAKELFRKHDQPLSSRAISDSIRGPNHDKFSVVFLPTDSPQWRNLRKVITVHLLSLPRLDATQDLRRKKVQQLIDHVVECCESRKAVQINLAVFTTVLNLISNTIFSIDLAGNYESDSSQEFKDIVWQALEEAGKPNVSDFFPLIRFLDLQGIRKRFTSCQNRFEAVLYKIINQRLELRASSGNSPECIDILDSLLDLKEENGSDMSLDVIIHLLLDIFAAGTDTTSSTVEWAMTELLHNPQTLAKVQTELRQVLDDTEIVQESDISRLPYLQAVIKETFRLHPPIPFLVPRKAEMDVELCGFTVPKDAQILINIWAMGRDLNIWSDPNVFSPERFLDSEIDVKGKDFELIPFGAGRRICPGLLFGYRMLHVILASFIKSFNWEIEDGGPGMDMNERFGFTITKANPLRVLPVKV